MRKQQGGERIKQEKGRQRGKVNIPELGEEIKQKGRNQERTKRRNGRRDKGRNTRDGRKET